jgi:hypothetical protein
MKLQELGDKEKQLHDKEAKNEELRRLVEAQKKKVLKSVSPSPSAAPSQDPLDP